MDVAGEAMDSFEDDGVAESSEEYDDDDIAEAGDIVANDDMETGAMATFNGQSEIQKYREKTFIDFINENKPITQNVKNYLNVNYQTVSSPLCQFDCTDNRSSDYAGGIKRLSRL